VRTLLTEPTAAQALSNPAVPSGRRVRLVEALATPEMRKEGLNLARMLVAAGRPALIEGIVEEYGRLADEAEGRVRATATTAVELGDPEQRRLAGDLSRRLGKDVRLEVVVDPGIIGGLVLQLGDRVIDASIRSRLQQLRRRLETA
jgi:F-type H+-transporting ATPase subunit delta